MRVINSIRKKYIIPQQSASFGGISKVYRKYDGKVPLSMVKKGLQGVTSYSLHRERKKPRQRNPFFILEKRQQIQIDLLDISVLSDTNDGVKYLFCGIDMFSKLAFVAPMKNKTARSSSQKILNMLRFYESKPKEILSDRGTEFKNSLVRTILDRHSINHRFTNSEIKCGGIERFNKTIQGNIYQYMTQNETSRYLDQLENLVKSYNSTTHSTIGISPYEAENERFGEYVRGKLYSFYDRGSKYQKRTKFRIGDHVRISVAKSRFQRSYGQSQTFEVFEIDGYNSKLPIPMYFIRSLYDGDVIQGGFYESELVKVDCLRIEVIQSKGRKIKVRWLDDPNKKESWINGSKKTIICEEEWKQ